MTTPKVTTKTKKNLDYDRWYVHDTTGQEVPGVSAIKSMYPSPALSNWFKRKTAEYCVDNVDAVRTLASKDKQGAVSLVRDATSRYSRTAADKGTDVHALCEEICRAIMAGTKPKFSASPEEMKYLRNFARFIKEFNVKPVMIETTVWSQEHRYAGTFDLMCELEGYPGYSIVDTKSGQSGVYHDAGIQQTAYRWAEYYIDEEGEFQPMPAVERAFGLWLRPDGWALIPLRTDEVMWEHFLRLRQIYEYKVAIQDTVVSQAVNQNPLKKKWRGNR